MTEFTAKYAGRCANCDDEISPGDLVHFVGTEVEHVSCPGARPPRPVCEICWLEIPANGECGCD